jgi:hypothetical protein
MLISHSIDIQCPQQEVFDFVSTFENDTKWWKAVDHTDKITPGPLRVGTEFHQVSRVAGIKIVSKLIVTEVNHFEYVRYKSESKQLTYALLYRFEKVAGGTRFTLEADLELKGALGAFIPLTMRILKGQLNIYFGLLKEYMETHPTSVAAV